MSRIEKIIKKLRAQTSPQAIKPLLGEAANLLETVCRERDDLLVKCNSQQTVIDSQQKTIDTYRDNREEEKNLLKSHNEELIKRLKQEEIKKAREEVKIIKEEEIRNVVEQAEQNMRNMECEIFYIKQAIHNMLSEVSDKNTGYDEKYPHINKAIDKMILEVDAASGCYKEEE